MVELLPPIFLTVVTRQSLPVGLGGDPFPDDYPGYTPVGLYSFVASHEEYAHHRQDDG